MSKALRVTTILLAFVFTNIFLAPSASAQIQTKAYFSTKLKENTTIGYLSYLPPSYKTAKAGAGAPLMIFLHGLAQIGSNLDELRYYGPPSMIMKGTWDLDLPFIVVSPQTPSSFGNSWNVQLIDEVIETVKLKYKIDASRIYLTGTSMGGNGVWNYAVNYPAKIAAVVPICGWGSPSEACKMKDVPTWTFHNDGDDVVNISGSNNMINALNNCVPAPAVTPKFTVYNASGHDSWTRTYDGSAGHDIYSWMLKYQVGAPTNQLPVANAGSDETLTLPTNAIKLRGSGTDADGTITGYTWTKTSGPTATMTGSSTRDLSLTKLVAGTYIFRLTVKDDKNTTDSDDVKVIVNPANQLPVANAGGDKTLTLPTNAIKLRGSGTDADGTITGYTWTKTSGPSATMTGATTKDLSLTKLVAGTYRFRLTVKDDKNETAYDEIKVVVNNAISGVTGEGGLDYAYYEGSWTSLPNFRSLKPKKTGTTATFSLLPRDRNDYFAFAFKGYIDIATAGTYTFFTASDDGSKLFINGNMVVDNDGAHGEEEKSGTVSLTAGRHAIEVTYFERNGGEVLDVYYQGPYLTKRIIPASALFRVDLPPKEDEKPVENIEGGIAYAYFEGTWDKLPDFALIKPIKKGTLTNFSLTPKAKNDYFAFKFDGSITISTAGNYTFYTTSDDGSKLYINGQEVVNNDGLHGKEERSGVVYLTQGQHAIGVTFFEKAGGETLIVQYAGPGVTKQNIPDVVLQGANAPVEAKPAPSDDAGLTFSYYEGTWDKLPDFSALSPIKTGELPNFSLTPRNRNDNFAFKFDGSIEIGTSGIYTFYTTSDDGSKLYINGNEIVNNDGVHAKVEASGSIYLDQGQHGISVTFFDRTGGEFLEVRYAGPGIAKQQIPYEVLVSGGTVEMMAQQTSIEAGVTYSYYEGTWEKIPDFTTLTPVKTGTIDAFNLKPRLRNDYFALLYEGMLDISTSGNYTFYTASDDGSKLYIDANLIVDNDGIHGAIERSGTVYLEKGLHPIAVAYFENRFGENLLVSYEGPGVTKMAIPAEKLSTAQVSTNATFNAYAVGKTEQQENKIMLYPNPFIEEIQVQLTAADATSLTIAVYDMQGKIRFEAVKAVNAGAVKLPIDLSPYQLETGIYIIKVHGLEVNLTQKIIKQ